MGGGHGALTLAMRHPGMYKSASAFAPICNPMKCPWGVKAFTTYLGADQANWAQYDATELLKTYDGPDLNFLIDQGLEDGFHKNDAQLLPENFTAEAEERNIACDYRAQAGYDHSYFFVSTFLPEHVAH